MKKTFMALAVASMATACNNVEEIDSSLDFVATGYHETNVDTRTAFDTPVGQIIPYSWSSGDYIWLGTNKSDAISEGCKIAQFTFSVGSPAIVGTGHVFYNLTGQSDEAKVLTTQTADGNLGNDGDFGYATIDKFGSFYLKHKTSYIWFDTTTEDANMPKLTSITVHADGVNIAGEQTYDFVNDQWESTVTNGSSTITLNFAGGFTLASSNTGVMAAMVCLPAKVGGKTLTVTYTFEDGSSFTETKTPKNDFTNGATSRIKTAIKNSDLVKEPSYELRVLTFEDEDAKFTPYSLDYANKTISKWSDLVDDAQYGGTLTYNNYGEATYHWYDENNTEIEHSFTTPYWGGGHAISNFVIENYETLPDGYYGWYELQFATPIGGHNNSKNFCVHNGYQDDYNSQIYDGKLAWFSFKGVKEQVVDHMFVTNTCYVLNSLMYGDGFNSPATDDTWVKIVAYGYNANEEEVGTSEFYLCNTGRRFVTDWQKWDLSSLGKVNKIVFNFAASDDQRGSYGLNCPAYFAYDDVAVQFTE